MNTKRIYGTYAKDKNKKEWVKKKRKYENHLILGMLKGKFLIFPQPLS